MLKRLFGFGSSEKDDDEDSREVKMEIEDVASEAKKSPKKRMISETEEAVLTSANNVLKEEKKEEPSHPKSKKSRHKALPTTKSSTIAFVPRQTKSRPNKITEPISEWNSKTTLEAMRASRKQRESSSS
mmetsp:Transcript_16731/g.25142  ORF Transcript_16731/g.25142 Transcript_16731/m.25142 type:complete len:129 (-) Transcript_16731:97-483(-)